MNRIFENKNQKFLILISIINLFYSTIAFAESKTPYVGVWACNMMINGETEVSSSINEWTIMKVTKDTISISGAKPEKMKFEKSSKKNEYPFIANNISYQFVFPELRYFVMSFENASQDEVCIRISDEDEAKITKQNKKFEETSSNSKQKTTTDTNIAASANNSLGSTAESKLCYRGENRFLNDPSFCLAYTQKMAERLGKITPRQAQSVDEIMPMFSFFTRQCSKEDGVSPEEQFKRGKALAELNIVMLDNGTPLSEYKENINYCANVVEFYAILADKLTK